MRHSRKSLIARPDAARVLIVIAGLIGDSVMCTPVLAQARRLWPRARLTLLGMRQNRELLEACPFIDDVLEARAYPFSIRGRHQVSRLARELRAGDYEVALILLGDQFASLLHEAGIAVRVGVKGTALEPCLTHTYELRDPHAWGPRERLNALRALGFEVTNETPALWVSDVQREDARRALGAIGIRPGEPYVVVHPFGRLARQWWPIERAASLALLIQQRTGMRTVLVGHRETRAAAGGIARENLLDAIGRLTLRELVATIEGATLTITTDSGPFHIAGALGRPVVGLFRSARPEYAALYASARILLGRDPGCVGVCSGLRCRTLPCSQLEAIGHEDAARAAEALLVGPISAHAREARPQR